LTTKNQHYVTQSYLRLFASHLPPKTRKKHQARIYCFQKEDGSVRERRIENIPCSDFFYDYIEIDGEVVSLEEMFGSIETLFMPAVKDVCRTQSIATVQQYRRDLAYFIASQMMRTPAFRILQEQVWVLLNDIDRRSGKPTLESTDNIVKMAHGRFIKDYLTPSASILYHKRWMLLYNVTSELFYTSDNPVVMFIRDPSVLHAITGLQSPGIRIYLPLNPRTALLLCDSAELAYDRSEILPKTVHVSAFNQQQVVGAERWVFSQSDDFSTAKVLLAYEPKVARRHRERIQLEPVFKV